MVERLPIPRDLRAVAWMHGVLGAGALCEVAVLATRSHFQLSLGVLGIPICFGLLRGSRGWRTCALVLLWLGLLFTPFVFVASLCISAPATFGILGMSVAEVDPRWVSVVAALTFVLLCWQVHVLGRPAVRERFVRGARCQPST